MSAASSLHPAGPTAAGAGDAVDCPYCANVKLLRAILPPKRCDYCREWRCQFCTLKFPLLGVRKVLPKALKGNSRICLQCFGRHWRLNGLSPATAASPAHPLAKHVSLPELADLRHRRRESFLRDSLLDAGRRDSMLIDDVWAGKGSFSSRSTRLSFLDEGPTNNPAAPTSTPPPPAAPKPNKTGRGAPHRLASLLGLAVGSDPTGSGLITAVDLWMSLFSATILLVIALAEGLSLQQRACYCVATYGLFLSLHPWIYAGRLHGLDDAASDVLTQPADPEKPKPMAEPEQQISATPHLSAPIKRPLPPDYQTKKSELEETAAYYLSPKCPWKQVRSSDTCTIYELPQHKSPCPIFKLEMFITSISMAAFMAHIRSTDLQDRLVWDVNAASFEVVERFDCADADVAVCVNTQKPFLGGLVASRDFCLLYVNTDDTLIFSSVEHPEVPPRSGSTRAHLFMTLFACREGRDASGTPGFTLTNVGQVDIRGSLPTRMLYKGTMDNMENVLKVFKDAHKLFPKAARA